MTSAYWPTAFNLYFFRVKVCVDANLVVSLGLVAE
jgi:hypothetical protein